MLLDSAANGARQVTVDSSDSMLLDSCNVVEFVALMSVVVKVVSVVDSF